MQDGDPMSSRKSFLLVVTALATLVPACAAQQADEPAGEEADEVREDVGEEEALGTSEQALGCGSYLYTSRCVARTSDLGRGPCPSGYRMYSVIYGNQLHYSGGKRVGSSYWTSNICRTSAPAYTCRNTCG